MLTCTSATSIGKKCKRKGRRVFSSPHLWLVSVDCLRFSQESESSHVLFRTVPARHRLQRALRKSRAALIEPCHQSDRYTNRRRRMKSVRSEGANFSLFPTRTNGIRPARVMRRRVSGWTANAAAASRIVINFSSVELIAFLPPLTRGEFSGWLKSRVYPRSM